jgi:hypothetical protein
VTALRGIAALAGLGILAAVAHVTIVATGGYADANAPITIALACGVAVGAPIAGLGSRGLAIFLIAALIAGELYGFLAMATWHVSHIETQATPVHEAAAKHEAAEAWLARLDRDDRIERAERALASAQTDARTKSTAKDCAKGCIATLAKTVDDATTAVRDARASLQLEKAQARDAIDNSPQPGSASPLADRLGIAAWKLDLIGAGLRSFACTVLAGALLAFAAHGTPNRAPEEPATSPIAKRRAKLSRLPEGGSAALVPVGDVDQFLAAHVTKAKGASVSWIALFMRYRDWCEVNGGTPIDVSAFGARLDALREGAGLRTRTKGKEVFFVDWKIAS